MKRRRFLAITAGAAGSVAFGSSRLAKATALATTKWHGFALGAEASIEIAGTDDRAQNALQSALDTVRRMEKLFSLYDPTSELSKLNRDKILSPSAEFWRLKKEIDFIHSKSNGLFDPTIQPLYSAYALGEDGSQVIDTVGLVGWRGLIEDNEALKFDNTAMSMTFNGIAQGFATDRVSEVLNALGYDKVVVNIGELRAGSSPVSTDIISTDDKLVKQLSLTNKAAATTAPMAQVLPNQHSHVISPDGKPLQPHWKTVTVIADTATRADGFSTALALTKDTTLAKHLVSSGTIEQVYLQDQNRLIELDA